MIRSPFKRASQAVDNIDYSTDEGKDKGARVAVILAPIAIVLTVLAVVGIWLFASGRFNPEKDAFQEAQKQLQENTERSEKGVANAGVARPVNAGTTSWTLFPALPGGASWDTSNVAYDDGCLSLTQPLKSDLASAYKTLSDTEMYVVAYSKDLNATPGGCTTSTLEAGYYFLSDGASSALYVAHVADTKRVDADNAINIQTANGSYAIWEQLFRKSDEAGNPVVRNLPDGWDSAALIVGWHDTPSKQAATMFEVMPATLYVASYSTPVDGGAEFAAAWQSVSTSPAPRVVLLKNSQSEGLLTGSPMWFTSVD